MVKDSVRVVLAGIRKLRDLDGGVSGGIRS